MKSELKLLGAETNISIGIMLIDKIINENLYDLYDTHILENLDDGLWIPYLQGKCMHLTGVVL